ncbi:MAG: hypothetical protein AABW63_00825 [Nanoarchaeota archaeon]
MKKGLVIGIVIIILIAIVVGILVYPNPKELKNNVVSCSKINETCGGGVQGPNGESNYIKCCAGLTCGHGGYESSICINESK